MRKKMIGAALVALGVYAGVCGIARASYRTFLYPAPGGSSNAPRDRLMEAPTSDGTTARALDYTKDGDACVFVFFHGNGENAEYSTDLAEVVRGRGCGSVFVEYRGYGVSRDRGKPNEEGLYADAAAILDALGKRGIDKTKIVLVGYSLGSGVAAEMAARGRARALVLLAPFTSIPEVAGRHVPFLPTRAIIGDRFDTLSKAEKIDLPVTIVHGTDDEVVPYDLGERLSKTFPHAKLVTIERARHTDLFVVGGARVTDAILEHA